MVKRAARLPRPPGLYLSEVVQGLVQVGVQACGRLVGDLNGVLQDALGDDVALRGGRRLCTDEDPQLRVAVLAMLCQLLLQGAEPLGHQVDVLRERRHPHPQCRHLLSFASGRRFQEGSYGGALAFK